MSVNTVRTTLDCTTNPPTWSYPIYEQPCRCNDCPTCGRPRSWWPWNWYWRYEPNYQFPAADRADWSFTNAASATA